MKDTRTRKFTTLLLDSIADGSISAQAVAEMCLRYLSEADVADMCETEGLFEEVGTDE